MLETRIAETDEEREAVYRFRYSIYVEEMGRCQASADHVRRLLADEEDERSWIAYAVDGSEIVGTHRITWGGAGFSVRAVGERAMVAPAWRGRLDLLTELGRVTASLNETHGVRMVFGACEPHLISYYCRPSVPTRPATSTARRPATSSRS